MQQFSVRLPDDQGDAVRRLAAARGRSVNQTFSDLVAAATDPATAADEAGALRERLDRAGLAFDAAALPDAAPPSPDALARARAAAGRGTPLAEIVAEGRR